ncbi:MAG: glycosyltransferase family protein [Patescibacteria group bacterium]
MKTYAIIQARMASTRLPGKILLDIAPGTTVLECMLSRVAACTEIDTTIVATTTSEKDLVLIDFLEKHKLPYFVGDENDVLDRYYQTALAFGAKSGDVIVRMTSDCPLIDPSVADTTIRFFKDGDFEYASNNLEPYTYADGMDTEVFSFDALERAWKESTIPAHREHVTFYMWKNPELFRIGQYVNPKEGQVAYRLTLDYQEDLDVLSDVYQHLYPQNPLFTMEDILGYLNAHPEVKALNTDVERNASWK